MHVANARCMHCNDTGSIVVKSRSGNYVGPGTAPDYVKGFIDLPCDQCVAGLEVAAEERAYNRRVIKST